MHDPRGGALAVIGMDPHAGVDDWYGYCYFEGVYETDLLRFPAWETVTGWMRSEGFECLDLTEVEHIKDHIHGRAVLSDPFLQKYSSSQLALLTQEVYEGGLRRIEADLRQAEEVGETLLFPKEFFISMLTGYKPAVHSKEQYYV